MLPRAVTRVGLLATFDSPSQIYLNCHHMNIIFVILHYLVYGVSLSQNVTKEIVQTILELSSCVTILGNLNTKRYLDLNVRFNWFTILGFHSKKIFDLLRCLIILSWPNKIKFQKYKSFERL